MLYDLLGKGYETVKIDGEIKQLREKITLTKTKRHDIDVQLMRYTSVNLQQTQKVLMSVFPRRLS